MTDLWLQRCLTAFRIRTGRKEARGRNEHLGLGWVLQQVGRTGGGGRRRKDGRCVVQGCWDGKGGGAEAVGRGLHHNGLRAHAAGRHLGTSVAVDINHDLALPIADAAHRHLRHLNATASPCGTVISIGCLKPKPWRRGQAEEAKHLHNATDKTVVGRAPAGLVWLMAPRITVSHSQNTACIACNQSPSWHHRRPHVQPPFPPAPGPDTMVKVTLGEAEFTTCPLASTTSTRRRATSCANQNK